MIAVSLLLPKFSRPNFIAAILAGVLSILTVLGQNAFAQEPIPTSENGEPAPEFVRLRTSAKNVPLALETSIVRLESTQNDGVRVDLIGAIHFGESSYYQSLNERFQDYDVVLFEMVLPKNAVFSAEALKSSSEDGSNASESPTSPLFLVGVVQKWLGETLQLTYQLDGIDYAAANFKHCDLDAETVWNQMFEKGDANDFFYQAIFDSIQPSSGQANAAAVLLLFSRDRKRTFKRFAARSISESFAESKSDLSDSDNAIIGLRNELVLERLRQEILDGNKRIAIFYGAAHLPHFLQTLVDEFHFQVKDQIWLTAWKL